MFAGHLGRVMSCAVSVLEPASQLIITGAAGMHGPFMALDVLECMHPSQGDHLLTFLPWLQAGTTRRSSSGSARVRLFIKRPSDIGLQSAPSDGATWGRMGLHGAAWGCMGLHGALYRMPVHAVSCLRASCDAGKCIATLEEHHARVRAVAYSPCGTAIASGGDDKRVHLWRVQPRGGEPRCVGPLGEPRCICGAVLGGCA